MAKTPVTPKVPGETVAEPLAPETVPPEVTVPEAAAETVEVSKASLDALLARVAALEAAPQVVAKRANPEADLPDQDDIDVATLKTPILTKQGWLVPEKFGSSPVAKNL